MRLEHASDSNGDRHSRGNDCRVRPVAQPQIVAITSGKGGVGKTSLAVNLGITLARSGHRVCILDADTGLANVNILLGLRPEKSLEHVFSGHCRIDEILLEGPYGLKVIPGANGIPECVNLEPARKRRLIDGIAGVEGDFDYLLLDTAAGISDTTLDFVSAAHRMLLIITPEPTSLTDAFSLLKLVVRRHPVECGIVVNFVASFNEAQSVFQRFQGAVLKFLDVHVNYLGFVRIDESMRTAVSLQRPVALFPQTDPSARAFQRLADRLEETAPLQQTEHFFSRYWARRLQEECQGADFPGTTGSSAQPLPRTASTEGSPPTPGASEGSVSLALQESSPHRNTRSLEVWRAEFDRLLAETEDPDQLASWLESLHAAFMDRYGKPALELPALTRTRTVDQKECFEALPDLSRPLGGDKSEGSGVLRENPDELTGTGRALEAARTGESKPDFGLHAAPLHWQSDMTAHPMTSPPAPKLSHAYDASRFGSQEELLRRLRQTRHSGVTLWGLLRQL